ncbi:MAG: FAD-binding protein [archaeon]
MKNKLLKTDCGVIGGGLAGCAVALELAEGGKKVDLFVKGKFVQDCNSYLTAGGLAAVPLVNGKPIQGDSFKKHISDTLKAGNGINDKKIVKFCVENFFREVIEWLAGKGVQFDKAKKGYEYDLHREGGHSASRIFHVKDTTGISVMEVLAKKVLANRNITVHENHIVIDLITRNKLEKNKGNDRCYGFYVYDIKNNYVKTVSCRGTFVATGGVGKAFLYTSNTDAASGDGLAMCHRAGLPIANMEFVQFHPTVFYDMTAVNEIERRFLLTEALRGAGAILKLYKDSKEDVILKYNPEGSKSTRDVVTKAEDAEMRKKGLVNIWLDCTSISKEKLKNDFKNSYDFCMSKGIDLAKEPAPVVYAEHYSNGGVLVNENSETAIKGCYVIGEAAYTGLHGATRLASNSAPECILFGKSAARHFIKNYPKFELNESIPLWNIGEAVELRDRITVSYYWEMIRRTMNAMCGVSRNEERMTAGRAFIASIKDSINKYYWGYKVSNDFLEVRNIAEAAEIILESALFRKESRACHFRDDFPKRDDKCYLGITIIQKGKKPRIMEAK